MKNALFILIITVFVGESSAQSRIAHLNSQEIFEATSFYLTMQQKIQLRESELMNGLRNMVSEFETVLSCCFYDRSMCRSPILVQRDEEKLVQLEKAILDCQESIQEEMKLYSDELSQQLLDLLNQAVNIVSDRHGYNYVFDITTPTIRNGPDITKEVITEIAKLEK